MNISRVAKTVTIGIAIAGVVGSAIGFVYSSWQDVVTRRIEARKPFLDAQLRLYTEATQTAAVLATADPGSSDFNTAQRRFWSLYWGELALVESGDVESAMARLGRCLRDKDCRLCGGRPEQQTLQHCVLGLAHACRSSLAQSWGVAEWRYEMPGVRASR